MFATLIFRAVLSYDDGTHRPDKPRTAWGERAYLYCTEETPDAPQSRFAYSYMESGEHDGLYFLDYTPAPHGNHHDFYGNKRYVNIVCDIAKGRCKHFSEYDLEAVADMIRLGYVTKSTNDYQVTFPVYTKEAYQKAEALAWQVVTETLADTLHALTTSTEKILSDHTPKHVQNQVAGIAGISNKSNAISATAEILVEQGTLCTDWNPAEMPTTYLVIRS